MDWFADVKSNFDGFDVKLADNGFLVEFTCYDTREKYRTKRLVMRELDELVEFITQARAFEDKPDPESEDLDLFDDEDDDGDDLDA